MSYCQKCNMGKELCGCGERSQVDETIKERGRVYGDPSHSHENIGLAWTGLIQQSYGIKLPYPLPDWLVELMMVSFKVQRSARVYHADNYIDLAAYAKFAEEDQKKAFTKAQPSAVLPEGPSAPCCSQDIRVGSVGDPTDATLL